MQTTTEFQLEYSVVDGDTLPCAAILVAAGNATRMGGEKQFLSVLGIPVLVRTMLAFEQCDAVRDIVVVARDKDIPEVQVLADAYGISKLTAIVAGGKERQDSVENGLQALASDVFYVAIHDGARPLITPQLIHRVIEDAHLIGAAAPGVLVKDTIKQADEDKRILRTVPRSDLYAIQTPQVFDRAIYSEALAIAKANSLAVTDDCMLCESAGFPVKITEGSYRNIKITTQEDVAFAEVLLRQEEQND